MVRYYKSICSASLAGVLFVSILTISSEAETFRYSSHGKRDPFVPLIGHERVSVIKLSEATSIDEIKLEGIAAGAKGEKTAIINGEIFKENSKTGEITIKKITDKTVTLLMSGQVYDITLQEGGEKK